ncbi:hypothetical protein TNCV_2495581 [Trichonephila clavipes]|nr:hypothetical protein TNCV_2495581 [Trichonephila clavipes]
MSSCRCVRKISNNCPSYTAGRSLTSEAPSHYRRCVREHLDHAFPNRWIGCGSSIAWPPRSSDLSPLGYHEFPVSSEMNLVARISIAASTIRKTLCIFKHDCQSVSRWCRTCMHANDCNF